MWTFGLLLGAVMSAGVAADMHALNSVALPERGMTAYSEFMLGDIVFADLGDQLLTVNASGWKTGHSELAVHTQQGDCCLTCSDYALKGQTAYCASGFCATDVSHPLAARMLNASYMAQAFWSANGTDYVLTAEMGKQSVSVRDVATNKTLGTMKFDGFFFNAFGYYNGMVYLYNTIIDVRDVNALKEARFPSQVDWLVVSDNRAYTFYYTNVTAFDMTDPMSPRMLWTYNVFAQFNKPQTVANDVYTVSMALDSKGRLYVGLTNINDARQCVVAVVDVTAAEPQYRGLLTVGQDCHLSRLHISEQGDRTYGLVMDGSRVWHLQLN